MDYELIADAQFWRDLTPELTISDAQDGHLEAQVQLGEQGFSRERLINEGIQNFDEVIPVEVVKTLQSGIEQLHSKGWMPVFGFLYDDYWRLMASIRDVIVQALGFDAKMMPDFWIWYVDPTKEEAGWKPHREKTYDTLLPDGMPKCMTAWIPLTDADPLNGCLYFIPTNRDHSFRDFSGKPPKIDLQNIRAMPAKAGSILIFNEMIYHWGSRSSKYAKGPRLSLAYEFQRGDVKPYNEPLIDLQVLPSFGLRWQLVGKQILQYQHMYSYPEGMLEIANRMIGRKQGDPIETPQPAY